MLERTSCEELPSQLLDSVSVNKLVDLGAHERLYVRKKVFLKEYIVRECACKQCRDGNIILAHIPGACRGRGGEEYWG